MCKRLQQREDTLLNLEPQVLQGLGFDLIAHSMHSALAGFFMARTPPMRSTCACCCPEWHCCPLSVSPARTLLRWALAKVTPCKAWQTLARSGRGLKCC